MAYSPPVFNLLCNIWDCRFPSDGAADWTDVPVQKYIRSRMSLPMSPQVAAGWWQEYTPPIQLRCPRNHLAFTGVPSSWSHLIYEVPSGSGQYYRVYWQEIQHQGFPNEYAIILVTPCDEDGLAIPPPGAVEDVGMIDDVCVISPPPPPPPASELEDTFSTSDPGTPLDVHTMDVGDGWIIPSDGSAWEIDAFGTAAICSADSSGYASTVWSESTLDDGNNHMAMFVVDQTGDCMGPIVRVQDENNYYFAHYNLAVGEARIYKVVAGTPTILDSAVLGFPPSNGDLIECDFTIIGSSLSAVFTHPSETITLTITDSTFASGVGVGMGNINFGSEPRCTTFDWS